MAFISKITEYIVDNYDLTKDYLTIIFPNKRAALTLRNELSKRINYNIWLPRLKTLSNHPKFCMKTIHYYPLRMNLRDQ